MEVGSEHPVKRATVRESEESMLIVISIRNRLVVSSLLLTTARNLEVKKGPGRTGSVKGKRFITCLNTLESVISPAGGRYQGQFHHADRRPNHSINICSVIRDASDIERRGRTNFPP